MKMVDKVVESALARSPLFNDCVKHLQGMVAITLQTAKNVQNILNIVEDHDRFIRQLQAIMNANAVKIAQQKAAVNNSVDLPPINNGNKEVKSN